MIMIWGLHSSWAAEWCAWWRGWGQPAPRPQRVRPALTLRIELFKMLWTKRGRRGKVLPKMKTQNIWSLRVSNMHLKEVYVAVATKIRMYTGLGENFAHPKVQSIPNWTLFTRLVSVPQFWEITKQIYFNKTIEPTRK